jgi:transposase
MPPWRAWRRWQALDADSAALERESVRTTRGDPAARRLLAIPGVGPLVASGSGDGAGCQGLPLRPRLAAWLGLTPRQHNSAGKRRSSGISKQGQRGLRTLLILGASAHLRHERVRPRDPWRAGRHDGAERGVRSRSPPWRAGRLTAARARRNAGLAWGPGPASVVGPVRRAVRESPQGQRSSHRAQRPDTLTAPDPHAQTSNHPCREGAVHT